MISLSAFVIATYSASVDERATIFCLRDPQAIGMPPSDTTWPEME